MLEVRNLVKKYPIGKSKKKFVTALNNVSITFPEKGLIFLLGKSGSGKSTLLNAIGGLDTFESGEIIIKGKSSEDFKQADFDSYRNTFVGFIFQEYNVLEEFTVAKNLSLAIELQGKKPSKDMVDDLLRMVEMQDFAKRKPNQLSGGQKQRIAIARALIKNPEIIMADEPTGALDSNTGKQVMETLKSLSKEKLVIIVSHDREFAEIYGDRIIELKDGKIIRDVTKKEIMPAKSVSGVSYIDNDIIHIKKGQSLTQEDLNTICRKIMLNATESDTVISLSPQTNIEVKKVVNITEDGNREVFKDTMPTDIATQHYNGKFKMIKSKLKLKDSFKMGASALKNKVGKLVFTILLSFIAFGMFGVIDTFSSFDRAKAVIATVKEYNYKSVSILKEKESDEYHNNSFVFKEEDVEAINKKYPDIKIKKIVNAGNQFGYSSTYNHYNNYLEIDGLINDNSEVTSILKSAYHSGMTYISSLEELEKYGIKMVAGNLPSSQNEICITKRHFDLISAQNRDKLLTPAKLLADHNICFIGNVGSCKIVGIIDDGSDFSKYDNITTQDFYNDYMLRNKAEKELYFGFANILLVSESRYNQLLNKPNEMEMVVTYNEKYLDYLNTEYLSSLNSAYLSYKYQYSYRINDGSYYLGGSLCDETFANGTGFITLPDNQIILDTSYFGNLFGVYSHDKMQELVNGSEPLVVTLQGEDKGSGEYKDVCEYTVVGYQYESYYTSWVSQKTLNDISSHKNQYNSIRLKNGDRYAYTAYNTIDEDYSHNYSDCNLENFAKDKITYIKNGKSIHNNGQLIELGENEIIIGESYLSSIGSGEELYSMIDEGLTIDFSLDYSGKNVLLSLKVVGVGYNFNCISNKTLNNITQKYLMGGSYAIAVLSNNQDTNKSFIEFCETFNDDNIRYTVQLGATPILDRYGSIFTSMAEIFLYIGIGFAIFASLLLMNFITTSISYKKREIGILRALGARGVDVFGIFFNESLIIALINFVLATIGTIIVCGIINGVIMTKLGLDLVILSVGLRQILLMMGVSLLTAFISSFIPVMKIAHKKPIDAINNR